MILKGGHIYTYDACGNLLMVKQYEYQITDTLTGNYSIIKSYTYGDSNW